ncbi:MAG TPA: metalloregulator ArsR/SmtB family transcription factor [Sedimentisphaerales bacterium]|nr:metalloregulator ArsR/SmtB family transcription factor [Sedimentisphaerales bacterium]
MADPEKLAQIFRLLSVDARVRIVQLLARRSYCVTELTSQLGITRPATSQHLRILRHAGLVKSQKRGFFVYYYLDRKKVALLRKAASELLKID